MMSQLVTTQSCISIVISVFMVSHDVAPTLAQSKLTPRPNEPIERLNVPAENNRQIIRDDGLTLAEVASLVRSTLAASDADLRRQACGLVAKRSMESRAAKTDGLENLIGLRPLLENAFLSDADERVRRAALIAEGRLEIDSGNTKEPVISRGFAELIAKRYFDEPSATVRTEIIKTLALGDSAEPTVLSTRTLLAALEDPAPGAVRFAVTGLGRAREVSALPHIIRLLDSNDEALKIAVASSLAMYGKVALPYRSQIERHVSGESNPAVSGPLRGVLTLQD